ncbi:deferrochelatase/peroxidase EfeB [Frankia sp. AgB1.9]|uniref:iron uptake transporter deferrochelatase/peroxidase subunit n=1 Tax=unclassified Frankia TaxID=2632575 RepID=UPI0019312311|nr:MULTISPECIES: iron uptake transporter deferrochelatase/peroxidase subunit [unclassified Frankia]MBL7490344.1 deferrochelatase/peroxidase EfeB [Frankia sp. AgW1.1]MBL7552764.1 deferrochelatase/peroxidase EfeB [Frankia sp. AgB1.9]MBL7625351.1 deferrochelatase/peroxidase EfeB [Frankia sp. AgB1.8]
MAEQRGLSRRRALLGAAGLAGAGAATLAGCSDDGSKPPSGAARDVVAFHGPRQAGVSTEAQDRLAFAAFDVSAGVSRDELRDLLRTWTDAASRMAAGQQVSDVESAPQSPPKDTGEALGLSAANLTITFGVGPSLFDDRFGLGARRPAALADIPALPRDELEPDRGGGDLCIQACADDPQVAFHAVRNLRRLAQGTAVLRWFQLGFGRTSTTSSSQQTPRNLMGFKDGTNNIKREDTKSLATNVWVGQDTDQAWMQGGTYVVTRRIRMLLEAWDRDFLADQEEVFGRRKDTGAPLGAETEFDPVPLAAKGEDGASVISADAHIRLAAPATNGGITLLRRGYSYTDGVDQQTGQLDAGLFFIAFQRDPRTGFVPVQRRLAQSDALNEYIRHTSSALFAVPPGVSATGGDYWARGLFA